MPGIILKEKIGDAVYNIIYIMLVTINMSVVFLLSMSGGLLEKVHDSRWFSEEIYLQSTQDAFFAEKFKMVYNVSVKFILISQIAVAIILLYIIISHINKWKQDMALLYTLGYKDKNMYGYLVIRNIIDTVPAAIVSVIASEIIFKQLIVKKLFKSIMDMSGVICENGYLRLLIICICVFAAQMLISVIIYKRQKRKNIRNVVEE